jgi:hypothetical protein
MHQFLACVGREDAASRRRVSASPSERDGGDRPGCGRREERCWADSSLAQKQEDRGLNPLLKKRQQLGCYS